MFEKDFVFFRDHLKAETLRQMTEELRSIEGECDAPRCLRSAAWCREQLCRAGASQVEVIPAPGDGKSAFNDCIIPKVWESTGHSFLKDEKGSYLADSLKEPRAIPPWSAPTPVGGITAEVALTPRKGTWFLSDRLTPQILKSAAAAEVAGVILNTVKASVAPGTVRWENGSGLVGWYPVEGDPEVTLFAIPPEEGKNLSDALSRGETPRLHGEVRRCSKAGAWNSVTGIIPGEESTEILLCAHLYEPFAADNAVSAPVLLELCRLIKEHFAHTLRHTVRFWFGFERYGLAHYLAETERSCKVRYLLNADCIANQATGVSPRLTFYGSSPTLPFFADGFFGTMAKKLFNPDSVGTHWGELTGDTFAADLGLGIPSMLLESCNSSFWHLSAPEFDSVDYVLAPHSGGFYGACALWLGRKENPQRSRVLAELAEKTPGELCDFLHALSSKEPCDHERLKNEMARMKRKLLLSAAPFEELASPVPLELDEVKGNSDISESEAERIMYRPRPIQLLSLAQIPREKRKNPPADLPEFRLLWSLIDGKRSLREILLLGEALTGNGFSAERRKAFYLHLDFLEEYGLVRAVSGKR